MTSTDEFDASRPDVGGLRIALEALPERLTSLATRDLGGLGLPDSGDVNGVVICAAGDDALDADLVAAIISPAASVPFVVHRGGLLPGWVARGSLVIVVALTRVDDRSRHVAEFARGTGADVVVVTADADFAATSATSGAKTVALLPSIVAPRVLPGVVSVSLLALAEAIGLYPGAGATVAAAIAQATVTTAACAMQPEGRKRSATATLARRIDRTLPLVYGADGPAGAAAQWWKSAVNQSAKLPAFADSVPAMSHSEFAMFGQAGDLTRQVFTMILLRAPREVEGSLAAGQLDRFEELFAEVVNDVQSVPTDAVGLGAYLDLAIRGQWVGVELANLAGVDPSAVSYLNEFWSDSSGH